MSAGIGSIGGGMGGNIGMNQISSATKSPLDSPVFEVNKKKQHGGDKSFEVMLIDLNAQKTPGIQSGSSGLTGTHVNKYA
ncbi:MAG: hypothetical protein ABSB95_04490 [Dissulfurispiraceae bacterium]|jgi:hypothetical protein